MAVWLYAYGKNGLLNQQNDILHILNQIELDEVKILDSIKEITKDRKSIETNYTQNRTKLEESFNAQTDEEYEEYLSSVNFPDIERKNLVDYLISVGVERERKEKLHFQSTYEQFSKGVIKSKWEKAENKGYFNKLCDFSKHGALRILLLNDLIRISGPFEVFSYYGTFQSSLSNHSREYYHSLFKRICKAFKSDFILYTHEWAGLDDEEDKQFDFKKLKEQSEWAKTSSSTIHNMESFYYEEI